MGGCPASVVLITSLLQGVLCNNWAATLPNSIRALTGSCLRIPCSFEIPDRFNSDLQNCTQGGVWIRGSISGPWVFVASQANNIIPGEMTGDVRRKNCTTVFRSFPEGYSDDYVFRLECLSSLKYTFMSGIHINAQADAPPLELASIGGVSEGELVRIQCTVPVPCPSLAPTLSWSPMENSQQEDKQLQQNEVGLNTLSSLLTFTGSPDHHKQIITCSASYPLVSAGDTRRSVKTLTLNIHYAPRFTMVTVRPTGPVPEGRAVNLTCSSDANPPVDRYTWYKDNGGQLSRRAEGEILLFLASQAESGVYICEVHNQKGSQKSKPVAVEVEIIITASERRECSLSVPLIITGVVLALFIISLVVEVYKYQSLARRLKQIELSGKDEPKYCTLTNTSSQDYAQIERRTTSGHCYENTVAMGVRDVSLPEANTRP